MWFFIYTKSLLYLVFLLSISHSDGPKCRVWTGTNLDTNPVLRSRKILSKRSRRFNSTITIKSTLMTGIWTRSGRKKECEIFKGIMLIAFIGFVSSLGGIFNSLSVSLTPSLSFPYGSYGNRTNSES